MQQNLRGLFERALDDEPLPPPGDPVEQAMSQGRRIRRRRGLLIGGSATAVVTGTLIALNIALAPAAAPPSFVSPAAMLMPPASAACTWPVQDNAATVSVFLRDDITVGQINTLSEALWKDPVVRDTRFESREQAYERFKVLWADSPDFVAAVSPANLPQSFQVDLAQPSGYRDFAARFRGRPGVQDLVGQSCPGRSK
ncbi:permease-like cell division protein FtsX [Actinoplanes sp. NPDC048791]|uniref:permease-like cell division protein FtsX n=1 Tax=Actinoplanes sp. NPDC048791 TaxID=3154623 RepID=UPI0033E43067